MSQIRRFLGIEPIKQRESNAGGPCIRNDLAYNDVFTDEASHVSQQRRNRSLDVNRDRIGLNASQSFINRLERSNADLNNRMRNMQNEYERIEQRLMETERQRTEAQRRADECQRQRHEAIRRANEADEQRLEAQRREEQLGREYLAARENNRERNRAENNNIDMLENNSINEHQENNRIPRAPSIIDLDQDGREIVPERDENEFLSNDDNIYENEAREPQQFYRMPGHIRNSNRNQRLSLNNMPRNVETGAFNTRRYGLANDYPQFMNDIPRRIQRDQIDDISSFRPPITSSVRYGTPEEVNYQRYSREEKLDARKFLHAFSGKSKENVDTWFYKMELYFKQFRVSENEKLMTCISLIKDSALLFFRNLETRSNTHITYRMFKEKFYDRYQPQNLQTLLRTKLRELRQTGSVADYIDEFDTLCCQIQAMSEVDQVQYFIAGLRSELSERVAFDEPRFIDVAKDLAIKNETYYKSCQFYRREAFYSERNHIKTNNFRKEINRFRPQHNLKQTEKPTYKPMNEKPKENTDKQYGITCYKCKGKGHYANECTKRNEPKTASMALEFRKTAVRTGDNKKKLTSTSSEQYMINTVNVKGNQKLMSVQAKIDGKLLECVIDTGATVSIMSKRIAEKNNVEFSKKTTEIRLANGKVIRGLITVPLDVIIESRYSKMKFVVMENDKIDVLLGLDWLVHNKASVNPFEGTLILPDNTEAVEEIENVYLSEYFEKEDSLEEDSWEVEEHKAVIPDEESLGEEKTRQIRNWIKDNRSAFAYSYDEIGICNIDEFKLKLMSDEPIYIPPYRKSQSERNSIKKEVDKMLKAGVIRESTSSYSFPVIIVPKKDSGDRFCVDYRKLNKITHTDVHPLPIIDDMIDRLKGSKFFSIIDLKAGYWEIKIQEDSIKYTAFSTPDGHYECLRLPFGVRNGPSYFSRIMKQVFGNCACVENYIDDIVVHSKSFEEHFEDLSMVFKLLKNANLKINPEKCVWFAQKIKLLGFVITGDTVEMDEDKIISVSKMKQPKNIKEIQVFLGLTGFYRKFIEGYSKITAPLTDLLKKETEWNFNEDCENAFNELKNKLISRPILRQPDLTIPFILYTDASGYAIGAILAQKDDKQNDYVVAYASRKLKGAEVHYGITEKECLAVVWAVKHFRHYLYGTEYTVVTDHRALLWLMSITEPVGRLARWANILQGDRMKIIHRPGRKHNNVDALSRPVLLTEEINEQTIEEDTSSKMLDPYEDDHLLYYLKNRKYMPSSTKKQIKRIKSQAERFKIEKDIIKYKDKDTWLVVPPVDERKHIILRSHLLGHFQAQTTYERLKMNYYWKNMFNDIKHHIDRCLTCIRHEVKPTSESLAMALPTVGLHDRIQLDLVFGLPSTTSGYIGVIVITNSTTKYPWAMPIRSKTKQEIKKKFWHYISIFGPPKEILTDQGKEFVNAEFSDLSDVCGIEHRVTSPYHPRTNGLTERLNSTLIKCIRKHAEDNPSNWNDWLPYVLLAYRTRIHSSTGFTPFELTFGRRMNHFDDYKSESNRDSEKRSFEIKNLIENTSKLVEKNIDRNKLKQIDIQNKRENVSEKHLKIGDTVTIKSLGLKRKLEPKYIGIFKVSGITEKGNYWLRNEKGKELKQSIPKSRIKVISGDLFDTNQKEHYDVEKILKHRYRHGKIQYYVKWVDYSNDECTWEPEENFDSLECIEEYWNTITTPVESANVAVHTMHKHSYKNLWKIQLLLLIFLFTLKPSYALKIKDKFKFCEIHKNKAIWDLPESCQYKTENKQQKDQYYNVLIKDDMIINGFGWMCTKKQVIITTYMDFIGTKTREEETKINHLTKEDCLEMVYTKKCSNNRMICNGNYCETDNSHKYVNLDYYWMHRVNQTFEECELIKQAITGENLNGPIHMNTQTINHCDIKSGHCKIKHSTLIWDNIINECPFKRVERVFLVNSRNLYFNKNENKVFQAMRNVTLCNNISSIETAEGLYLTTDKTSDKLETSQRSIKVIDSLILSEMDYKDFRLTNLLLQIVQLTNEKLCQMYKSFINLYSKMDDEFFKFFDFNGNEAILYSNQGSLFIPQCKQIDEIEIVTESEFCYKDFPIKIKINNTTLNCFMTQEKIIKLASKKVSCKNHIDQVYFKESKKLLIKRKTKTYLEDDNMYTHLAFNLQYENITSINYKHDKQILSSVNIIEKVADLQKINETKENFYVFEDHLTDSEENIENIINEKNSKLIYYVNKLFVSITSSTIGIFFAVIIIIRLIYMFMVNKNN